MEQQEIHKVKEGQAIELLAQQQMHATQLNAISARIAAYSRENEILRANCIDARFCEEHYRNLFAESSAQAQKVYDFACAGGIQFPIALSASFRQSLAHRTQTNSVGRVEGNDKERVQRRPPSSSEPSESSLKLWNLEKKKLMTKLDERSTQLAILMDTVKALRDEDSSEGLAFANSRVDDLDLPYGDRSSALRQRIVTLTAQLTTCASTEADLENRAIDLLSQVSNLCLYFLR